MEETTEQKPPEGSDLDSTAMKYTEKFDKFSKTKSGNVIVEFILFRKNLVPYTLVILYVIGVIAAWLAGLGMVFNAGPLATGTDLGDRLVGIIGGLLIIALAPFAIHYVLELVKYVFVKVAVPIWDKVVIRFFVNVLPELMPFLFERFMKLIDILLDCKVMMLMTITAMLKGVVWLPKTLCQRLGRWARKPLDGEVKE